MASWMLGSVSVFVFFYMSTTDSSYLIIIIISF